MYQAGYAAALWGENDRAEAWFGEALEVARAIGADLAVGNALEALGTCARERGDLNRAATLFAESLTLLQEGTDTLFVANCLKSLGAVAAVRGNAEQAVRLFGAAEALRDWYGLYLPPAELSGLDRAVAPARARLSSDTFAAAWAAGRDLPLDQAVAEALQVAQEITSEQPANSATSSGLSRREQDVLRLLVEGLTDKEIGEQLSISRRTASKHVEAILSKLDVPSRTAAATYANRHELI
jgi:DNA-binding CsgD family transcriptional regulator